MSASDFDELLRRWHQDEATLEDLQELETRLRQDSACRRSLVGTVLLESDLGRGLGSISRVSRSRKGRLAAWAAGLAAAVSLLATGGILLRQETRVPEPEIQVHLPFRTKAAAPLSAELRRLLNGARYPLTEAIEKALARRPGVLVSASLEEEDGRIQYAVKLVQNGRLWELDLDPATGEVLGDEDEGAAPKLMPAEDLRDLIRKLLARMPGTLLEVEWQFKNKSPGFEAEILSGGVLRELRMDPSSGEWVEKPE